jgi:hypothetical protein
MVGEGFVTKEAFGVFSRNLNRRVGALEAGAGLGSGGGSPGGGGGGGSGPHTILSATHTDSSAAACVAGDLIYGNGTPAWARLAKGTIGYVLMMGASYPAWSVPGSNLLYVNQAGHGLAVIDVVKNTGANTYGKAQADSAANAEVVGIVSWVSGGDFAITLSGVITSASVPALAAGTVVFLSAAAAGALTDTEPTGTTQVSKPLAIILESATKMVMINYRGMMATTPTHSLLDATYHTDTLVGAVQPGDVIYGNATPKWARLGKGSENQIFKIVSSAPAWSNPCLYMFSAYLGTNQLNLTDNTWTTISVDTENFDIGSVFAVGTYTFTAPITGYYFLHGCVQFLNIVGSKTYSVQLYKNGNTVIAQSDMGVGAAVQNVSPECSCVCYLNAKDTVVLRGKANCGANTVDILAGTGLTFIDGFYISV